MGRYIEMVTELDDEVDHSYASPERRLLWRLDDLEERLDELKKRDVLYKNELLQTREDIHNALPEHLQDIYSVELALELAKADLLEKYGIDVHGLYEENRDEKFDDFFGQISLFTLFPEAASIVA